MGKRKEITMKDAPLVGSLRLQWVGPEKPEKPGKYSAYIRFESEGIYRGSLSDRQAKKLMRWLNKYYGDES
jgi:hypothetical protein